MDSADKKLVSIISTPSEGDPKWDKIMRESMSMIALSPKDFSREYLTGDFLDRGTISADKITAGSITSAYTGAARGGGKSLTYGDIERMKREMMEFEKQKMHESFERAKTEITPSGIVVKDSEGRERVRLGSLDFDKAELRGVAKIAAELRKQNAEKAAKHGAINGEPLEPYVPEKPEPQIDRGEEWGSW